MVIQSFRPIVGGAELQLERLLPRLAERGVHVTVVTRGSPESPRRERLGDAAIVRTALPGRSPLASLAFVGEALAHLARHRRSFDLVHSHGALSEGTIVLGAGLLGLPAVVKLLRVGYRGDFERLRTKPGGSIRARRLAATAWFIATSAEARAELTALGVPGGRIFDIPNGVDLSVYRPPAEGEPARLRAELGLPAGPLGLYAGRLTDVKEVDTLIRALPSAPELALAIVGDGRQRASLEQLAAETGVLGRARFFGFSDRVPDFLRAADAFFLPSRSEGMSNALLEAMACGLPCIGTEASGVPELLAPDRGLLVPAGDVPAWGEAMSRVVGEVDELRKSMGARASRHVHDHFSLDSVADRLVAAYTRIAR